MVLKVEKIGEKPPLCSSFHKEEPRKCRKNPEESNVLAPGILFYPKERDFSPNPHCCPLYSSSSPPCHGTDFFFLSFFCILFLDPFGFLFPIIFIFSPFFPHFPHVFSLFLSPLPPSFLILLPKIFRFAPKI